MALDLGKLRRHSASAALLTIVPCVVETATVVRIFSFFQTPILFSPPSFLFHARCALCCIVTF